MTTKHECETTSSATAPDSNYTVIDGVLTHSCGSSDVWISPKYPRNVECRPCRKAGTRDFRVHPDDFTGKSRVSERAKERANAREEERQRKAAARRAKREKLRAIMERHGVPVNTAYKWIREGNPKAEGL